MKKFLEEVVHSLYEKYGEQISDLTIVFPNRRASLFFSRELSNIIDRAVWQPRYCSIDDLLRDYTGLEQANDLTLLAILYEVYCKNVAVSENFDSFYSWGQILLADFDSIDKYMIDSRKLYANMDDLQELDGLLGEDFEQKEIILNFWKTVKGDRGKTTPSEYFSTFLGIWSKLDNVYKEFCARLQERGIGYSGMIYRRAAQMFAQEVEGADEEKGAKNEKYIFVGFNALNKCEQLILDVLQRDGRAEFYWDADKYYLDDHRQEAGLFLRKNLSRYGSELPIPSNFRRAKRSVEVINAPNDIMQCKALRHKLLELHSAQGEVDSETAVVLTDENLLPVVLYSIPSQISDINITMGSPLNQSAPYVFFERLMALQMSRSDSGYYYDSVLALLSHDYIRSEFSGEIAKIQNEMAASQLLYVGEEVLNDENMAMLFPFEKLGTKDYLEYYIRVVERFAFREDTDPASIDNNEFTMALIENLRGIESVIGQAEIAVSPSILHSLLAKVNNAARVPFEGYPLRGLQVMGILESRCLDFRNVIILSMCDETFPGNKAANSFIPPNLRKGFLLPTQVEHGAMWAYYFYRLISRAQNVIMMYSSSREGNATGEKSRYIYQMEFESGHTVSQIGVDLNINVRKKAEAIAIEKNDEIFSVLQNMSYSPSGLNCYIDCPLKFYFSRLVKIKPIVQPNADIEANESGSILHKALELLYADFKGDVLNRVALERFVDSDVERVVDLAINDVLQGRAQSQDVQGRLGHLRRLLINQVREVVRFDLDSPDLKGVLAVEYPMNFILELNSGRSVRIEGTIDRIDLMNDDTVRVVDYKSGNVERKFKGVESLFTNDDPVDDSKCRRHNSAALQMLIYSLSQNGATPSLFSLKKMNDGNFVPYLEDENSGEVLDSGVASGVRDDLKMRLKFLFEELLDRDVPFCQTKHCDTCSYCDYVDICNRRVQDKS